MALWELVVSALDVRTMTVDEVVASWRTGMVDGAVLARPLGTTDLRALRDIAEVRERMEHVSSPGAARPERGPSVGASARPEFTSSDPGGARGDEAVSSSVRTGSRPAAPALDGASSRSPLADAVAEFAAAASVSSPPPPGASLTGGTAAAPASLRRRSGAEPARDPETPSPDSQRTLGSIIPITLASPRLRVATAVPVGFLAGALAATGLLGFVSLAVRLVPEAADPRALSAAPLVLPSRSVPVIAPAAEPAYDPAQRRARPDPSAGSTAPVEASPSGSADRDRPPGTARGTGEIPDVGSVSGDRSKRASAP
jgi:hypothetical protein